MSSEDFEGVAAMAGIKRAEIEPARLKSCRASLEKLGFDILEKSQGGSDSWIVHKDGKSVQFWPYTGWYNTIGFKKRFPTARGFANLLKEFKK